MGCHRQIRTDEWIQERIILMQDILDVLKRVEEGDTIANACRVHNFHYGRFLKLLDVKGFDRMQLEKRLSGDSMELREFLLSPTERIYREIFGEDKFMELSLPMDADKTLSFALSKLPDTEKRVLLLRYGINNQKKSYEECAKSLGVSRECVRQQHDRALKKLRHPKYTRLLLEGYSVYKAKRLAREQLLAEKEKMLADAKEKQLNALKEKLKEESAVSVNGHEALLALLRAVDIETLGLSTRTCNALKRAGARNGCDLMAFDFGALNTVKNLGKKSMQEVFDTQDRLLLPYGISIEQYRVMLSSA